MKNTFIIGGKLALICGIAAIVLGLVNAVTAPVIKLNQQRALEEAVRKVSGDMRVGEKQEIENNPVIEYYYPASGKTEGYILKLVGTGYGGDMDILAGFDQTGEIFSVVLMDNQETPGLGKKAESPEYMTKFLNTGGDTPVPVRKDQLPQEQADAITGATITYLGIANALAEGSAFVRDLGGVQ